MIKQNQKILLKYKPQFENLKEKLLKKLMIKEIEFYEIFFTTEKFI